MRRGPLLPAQQNVECVLYNAKAYLLSTLKLFSPHHFSRSVACWALTPTSMLPSCAMVFVYGCIERYGDDDGYASSRLVSTTAYIMLCFADVLHISLFVWRLALHVCYAHSFVSIVFVTAYFVIHMYFTVLLVVVVVMVVVELFIHTRRRETFQ